MSAAFWNGIIGDHAASQVRVTELVTSDRERAVEGLIAKGWAVRLPGGDWALTELGRDAADEAKMRARGAA